MDRQGDEMSTSQDTVRAYHERSKHQLRRYAAGPETLDWDAQPDPFRRWAGSPLTTLPLVAASIRTTWSELHGDVAPRGISRETIGALFELSFGLTAWKQLGPDRWALRANPSSGNLHPTEAYLLAAQVSDLEFEHFVDRASPNLMKYCLTGKHIPEAKLTVRKAGGNPLEYLKITMTDVLVTKVAPNGSSIDEVKVREKISLSFAKVKQEYTVQNQQGGSGGAVTAGYDIKANKEA